MTDSVELLRLMVLCRVLERTCCELNPRWFPVEGEEGTLVGAFHALRPDDFAAPHYRGPFIVYHMRGAELARLIGQVLAKANGYARGRALGFTGPIELNALPWVAGDLGTSLGVATGTALGFQYEGSDRVTVCSFGDGTSNRGDFHEALNLAAVWKLPIVYVCQNNQYSISLHQSKVLACASIADRAAGYGMPGVVVDGNDVLAVDTAVKEAVYRARVGEGPTLIEARTYRVGGHWHADPGGYRTDDEVAPWRIRDPVQLLETHLLERCEITQAELELLWEEARVQVNVAVEIAQAAPSCEEAGLGLDEVFA
ncbi:MAG TPA: thiamine pyrophosphate-dependent dehydrogenase E1 component subunit alpha [Chloroflexota bacterium]|nr:thiamine pyrophosphate-dependent dehydrogenase E1 component subunit alpha [Chloroflexota bacterium]